MSKTAEGDKHLDYYLDNQVIELGDESLEVVSF